MAFAPSAVNQTFPPTNASPCGPFKAPVSISGSANQTWMLLCQEDYDRLIASMPVAIGIEELTEAELQELEQSQIPEETRELDSLMMKGR